MKRPTFAPWTALLVASLVPASSSAVAAGAHRPHDDASLRQLFAAHEYGDGFHYAFQFHRDGRMTGTEMGKDVLGNWRATKSELCWTWTRPRVDEECHTVRRRGADVMLDRDGVEQWVGTLQPVGAGRRR